MQGKIKCTNCNNMIAIGAPYCIFCGVKQNAQNVLPENGKKRRKKTNEVPVVKAGTDILVPVDVEEGEQADDSIALQSGVESVQQEKKSSQIANAENLVEGQAIVKEISSALSFEEQVCTGESMISGNQRGNGEEALNSSEFVDKGKKTFAVRLKERKEEKENEYRQTHDELTELYNKAAYDEKMDGSDMDNICIIVMDVNSLEKVNHMHGKADGDLLLLSIAQVLRIVFGNNCYRMQDGEFCVVLRQITENSVINRIEDFRYELRKKEKELRETGKQLDLKMAIGYIYGVSGQNERDVYQKAQEYMREDKKRMKRIYDPNYDGYYNDVKAEYEDVKVEIDRENVHKAVVVVLVAVVFMIVYYIFLV